MTQIYALKEDNLLVLNRLNVQFRVVPDQIRIRLLQTYCRPTAWYGCQTWLLNTNPAKRMNIE